VISKEQIELAQWTQRMICASKTLREPLRLSLEAWMASGAKRSSWPGWVELIGPRPETKKPQYSPVEINARKSA
jgi:hypothetical protein